MKQISIHVVLLLLVVAWSCEQEGDVSISHPEPTPSTANEASSSSTQQATDSEKIRDQAFKELKYSFNRIYEISNKSQVKGLSRQEFRKVLQKSKISFIEGQLESLLSSSETHVVTLRKVKSKKTGKLVNVALLRIPEDKHTDFKPILAIELPPGDISKHPKLCLYNVIIPSRQRTSSDPKTLCIKRAIFIGEDEDCPPDECVGESPVVEPPASEAIVALAVLDSTL